MLNSPYSSKVEGLLTCSSWSGDFVRKESHQPPIVLAVDDDVDSLLLISCLLEPYNCTLFCEVDGRAALKTAQHLRPNLIVLDILLPGLSGLDVVKHLRRCEETRSIPVIAVSALASPRHRQEMLLAGCDQCMVKPYLLEELRKLMLDYVQLDELHAVM